MSHALDTSVLIAAVVVNEPAHAACARLLNAGGAFVQQHALAEFFATLTGGRQGLRRSPALATDILRQSVLPYVDTVAFTATELRVLFGETAARGVTGGAIYDYLHLAAARKAKASHLYTLNVRHFQAFHRAGDPEIAQP